MSSGGPMLTALSTNSISYLRNCEIHSQAGLARPQTSSHWHHFTWHKFTLAQIPLA